MATIINNFKCNGTTDEQIALIDRRSKHILIPNDAKEFRITEILVKNPGLANYSFIIKCYGCGAIPRDENKKPQFTNMIPLEIANVAGSPNPFHSNAVYTVDAGTSKWGYVSARPNNNHLYFTSFVFTITPQTIDSSKNLQFDINVMD